jgi:hypothetical protein
MKRLLLLAGLGLLASTSLTSAATDADCMASWKLADAGNRGMLTEEDGSRYYAAMRVAQKPIMDGKLTQSSFQENCAANTFATLKPDPNAPIPGANSFTEAQAKDRAIAAGLTSISSLKKDDIGVWRGTGNDGAKGINVAVDYVGNVVSN